MLLHTRALPGQVPVCPAVGTGAQGPTAVKVADAGGEYAEYTCDYTSTLGATGTQLTAVRSAFLFGLASEFYDCNLEKMDAALYPEVCSAEVESAECPPDPLLCLGDPDVQCLHTVPAPLPPQCSAFLSTTSSQCALWAVRQPGGADVAKERYCAAYPDASECACLLRADNPVYQAALNGSDEADYLDAQVACWFVPCSNPSSFLRTSVDVSNTTECESVCGIITINLRNYNPTEAQISVNCKLTDEAGTAVALYPPRAAAKAAADTDPLEPEWNGALWALLALSIVVAVVLVVVAVWVVRPR